ncbi:MAG: hypothetical protein M0C28_33310 [Candidatus Moduliflexus flocculans]|nr:hypothetical protein [Candidatus Moduliflexus flocculans]
MTEADETAKKALKMKTSTWRGTRLRPARQRLAQDLKEGRAIFLPHKDCEQSRHQTQIEDGEEVMRIPDAAQQTAEDAESCRGERSEPAACQRPRDGGEKHQRGGRAVPRGKPGTGRDEPLNFKPKKRDATTEATARTAIYPRARLFHPV